MVRFAALVLALSLAACEVPKAATPAVEYRPRDAGTVDHAMCLLGFTAVPLRELLSGHHLVDVTINGRAATFVLDTGANLTVVDARVAQDLGLAEGTALPAVAVGLGGGLKASQRRIETLRIGGVDIRQKRVLAADLSGVTRVLGTLSRTPIAGIVGQDVMKEHRAVIDVARPLLYLIAADRAPAPVAADRCAAKAA